MTVSVQAAQPTPPGETELAAWLAASVPVPVRLPVRYDGQRIMHLSATSYTLFCLCPDAWRRRYVLGIKDRTAAVVFLGRVVDAALSEYHRHELQSGERLAVEDVQAVFRDAWRSELEVEEDKLGVAWEPALDAETVHGIGEQAVAVALRRLVPQLGRPVAVQRRIEFKVSDMVDWTVEGHLDLETERENAFTDEPTAEVVDYKVKGNPLTQPRADRDVQAGIYVAGRWLERQPVAGFTFAQVLRPGERRKRVSSSLVHTTRTVGELRATLARLALAASQIVLLHETYGPERPWGFADPTSWKCSARYCQFHPTCPGGAGL
jgi:hypothetical protein